MNKRFNRVLLPVLTGMLTVLSNSLLAQDGKPYVRIASIVVDSAQVEKYNTALKEHAAAAIAREPGVLTLYGVYDKNNPTHVTVFEIYASVAAYQTHIQTAHFLHYKATVKDMVRSLVLTDVVPIALATKPK
ncbi:putative quinol monooxygenase [Paraflavitalea speifideaquila]|uniref:putative quinol monooxygenase n=1 Tax=Paraflavitalea speifideaquila TaxID=3076558 RepID=UPI0028E227F6|nr:putative quinol monooxygenase [Paraflavitalea speifideiaquila]